jgi:SHS family lactate transporter-like MFS transporter
VALSDAARRTFIASFLGWTLDAFDFFLLTFVVVRIGASFGRSVAEVTFAITLTLMCRPLGALLFGWIADRYGRRTPLMIDIALYSLLELLTAFSPNFTTFLVLRALFGVAMGGEWGLGAAITMEALPVERRGLFSGMLQQGYMVGYLFAALVYFFVFQFTHWDWRGLFVIGALPAVLIFYIRKNVPESPVWLAGRAQRMALPAGFLLKSLLAHLPLFVYVVLFMASLNGMSHGTQDLYATFLQKQRGFSPGITSTLSIVAAFGAITGGITWGALSQRIGRRATVMFCAVLAACAIPLWVFSPTIGLLGLGAFVMQFMVQGAWGVIPAHLNELSPSDVRGTFPGFTYQLGNLIAAGIAQLEATTAQRFVLPSGVLNYAEAMALVVAAVLACVIVLAAIGYAVRKERRDEAFAVSG